MFTAPDPEYYFLKTLPEQVSGYIGRNVKLSCLCAEDAQTVWIKDGDEVDLEDDHITVSSCEGENILEIKSPEESHNGRYSCKILKFGKEGHSDTSCLLNVIGNRQLLCRHLNSHTYLNIIFSDFPHKFVKRLQPNLDLTERDMLALQVTTQETFATVKWFKDDEEIKITRKRNPRLKIVTQDCHHILAIEKCIGSDRGQYSVATNTETTTCAVNVSGK